MRAAIVEQDGTVVVSSLDGLTVGSVRHVLNRPTSCSITVATLAPGLDELFSEDGTTLNEIQIWDGTTLVLWGIPVGIEEGPVETSIELVDPSWLFTKRYVGELYDSGLLGNGQFETADFTMWNVSTVDIASVDLSINSLWGDYVARLESAAPPSANKAAFQNKTLPTSTEDITYMARAYVWVEPLDPFATTDFKLGLVVQLYNSGVTFDDTTLVDEWWEMVDDSTDKNFWTRLSVPMFVPAHTGDWTLRISLASPQGVLWWDAVGLVEVKALKYLGTDQAVIAEALVEHAQDTAIEKGDLGILTDCDTTGITRNRIYPHAEHEEILQALIDLAEMEDGFDWSMVCDATTKTFTTHYPQKGSDLAETWTWGQEILDFTRSTDLSQAAGSVSMLGEGTTDTTGRADDREHRWAVSATAHSGRRLEMLEVAPPRSNIAALDARAEALIATRATPSVLTLSLRSDTVDFYSRALSGSLQTGDTVGVFIDHGSVQVDARYRIVELEADPRSRVVTPVVELVTGAWS